MFSIGEFSIITGLSIKALRLYHQKEILIPHVIDASTGYRYYNHHNVETARVIKELRNMEFSLTDIHTIIQTDANDKPIIEELIKHKQNLIKKIDTHHKIVKTLDLIIKNEKEAQMALKQECFEVEEKVVDSILIASIRYKGKYCDCGQAFGKICRKMGRLASGKPFNLYYDAQYKEDNADIESCVAISKPRESEGISIRTLEGGKCLSLIHKGSYDDIGRSYEKIIAYANQKDCKTTVPSREIYIKGPGMLFKGNPKKYLTEIQMMIDHD
jgi:effector-binding domain-containing protein